MRENRPLSGAGGKDWTLSLHDRTDCWKLRDSATTDTASGCRTCSMSVRHLTTTFLSDAFKLATCTSPRGEIY